MSSRIWDVRMSFTVVGISSIRGARWASQELLASLVSQGFGNLCPERGSKIIHVKKWSAMTKEDAHSLLVSWGYTGFADLGKRAPRETVGSAAKSRARKSAHEEEDRKPIDV